MAQHAFYVVLAVSVMLLLYIENTTATSEITCGTNETINVREGMMLFSWECLISGITTVTDNAMSVTLNGVVKPPQEVILNVANYTYQDPNKRYTIRTWDFQNIGGEISIQYALDIHNVSREDDGTYDFKLLNQGSLNINQLRRLSVYYIPEGPPKCEPSGEINNVDVSDVFLICSITSSISPPAFVLEWTRDNGNVLASTTLTMNGRTQKKVQINFIGLEGVIFTCTIRVNNTLFPNEESQSCQSGPLEISDVTQVPTEASVPSTTEASAPLTLSLSTALIQSSQLSTTTEEISSSESIPLSLPILITSSVGGVFLLVVIVAMCVCFIVKCRTKKSIQTCESIETGQPAQELLTTTPTIPQKTKTNDKLIYADLDMSSTPSSPDVRPLTEEPTVYASVKMQGDAGNASGKPEVSIESGQSSQDLVIETTPEKPNTDDKVIPVYASVDKSNILLTKEPTV